MNLLKTILILFLISSFSILQAQENDSIQKNNTETVNTDDSVFQATKKHSPKKAAIMSAIVPGLGQVYNKKYWKLPIVYGAYTAGAYFLYNNNKEYIKFREAYKQRIDDKEGNETLLPEYATEDLQILKNYYWKNRDLSFMILIGIHVLNILDATVDAHLFYFDISDDLTFEIKPSVQNTIYPSYNPAGISFTLKF